MSKYIRIPFATTGDKTAIPQTTQPDGKVSWQEGYGEDYSLDLRTDPNARPVERLEFNQLMFTQSDATRDLQQFGGVPEFITTADNGGSPFSYSAGVLVRYDPGSGMKIYRSIAASNTALPTDATKWSEVSLTTGLIAGSITDADVNASAGIDATKIGTGVIDNTEFSRLNGVTSNIQTQLDGKQTSGNYLTGLTGDGTASGPGVGNLTLNATGVEPGFYVNCNLQVQEDGRVTFAGSGPNAVGLFEGFESWSAGLPIGLPWTSGQTAQIEESALHVTQGSKSAMFNASGSVTMTANLMPIDILQYGEFIIDVYVGTIGPSDRATVTVGTESASTPNGASGAFTLRCPIPSAATTIALNISGAGQCWWDNLRYVIRFNASGVSYDNDASGLAATDVQAAIDELREAENIEYDNSTSGLTATNVQDAIDELESMSGGVTLTAQSVAANPTGSTAAATSLSVSTRSLVGRLGTGNLVSSSISSFIDAVSIVSATRGSVLGRSSSEWQPIVAVAAAGDSRRFLRGNSTGADASWSFVRSYDVVPRSATAQTYSTGSHSVSIIDGDMHKITATGSFTLTFTMPVGEAVMVRAVDWDGFSVTLSGVDFGSNGAPAWTGKDDLIVYRDYDGNYIGSAILGIA